MARIPAGTSELRNAFWQHGQKDHPVSGHLLLFYAVECGLKSVYLRRNRLQTTDQIPQDQDRGHDLARWIKELRLPASVLSAGATFRLARDGSCYGIEMAHQAWRYGVVVEGADEASLLEYLRNVQNWIQEALQQ
jgi:hypothetical protein